MDKKTFEEKYEGVVPKGTFKQVPLKLNYLGEYSGKPHHDTSHEVSIVLKDKGTAVKFAEAKHAHWAGYIEDVLNALHNGDLVWKEDCLFKQPSEDFNED